VQSSRGQNARWLQQEFHLTAGCCLGPLAALLARMKTTFVFERSEAPGPEPLLRHWGGPRVRGSSGSTVWRSGLKISEIWATLDPTAPGSIPSAAGFVRARCLISMLAGRRRCGALALRALRALLAYQLFLLLATMSSVFGSPGSCARRRAQTAFPLGMPTWPPVSSGTA